MLPHDVTCARAFHSSQTRSSVVLPNALAALEGNHEARVSEREGYWAYVFHACTHTTHRAHDPSHLPDPRCQQEVFVRKQDVVQIGTQGLCVCVY